jgi:hypothetical protein
LSAQADAATPLGHAENVTTRVFALEGFHRVLHHTSMFKPSVLFEPDNCETGPPPQQYEGGPAFKV